MALIEFQDLPNTTTPLNAANLNNNFEQMGGYQSTETQVGYWGSTNKPLYRKVVSYTPTEIIGASGSQTDINIPHNISNLGIVINVEAFNSSGYRLPIMGGSSSVSRSTSVLSVTQQNITMRIINDSWGPYTWYFILEYTKATD